MKSSFRAGAIAACLAFGAAMTGCTVLMTEPTRPDAQRRAAGLDYEAATQYTDQARAHMNKGLTRVDELDTVTRGAVSLGVGGGAIAALTKASSDVVLGLFMIGGTGYAINQTSLPAVQASIYSAGLKTLDCIERTGGRVHRETREAGANLLAKRGTLNKAINRLSADLDAARRQSPNPVPSSLMADAERVLVTARNLQKSVNEFLAATEVGDEMYYAVNRTVSTVNEQLRSRAPSLDEIVKAGSMLTSFVATNSKAATDALAARGAVNSALTAAPSQSQNKLVTDVIGDLAELRRVVSEVQETLPPAGYSTSELVTSCQTLLPGQSAFTVTPVGPIQLAAGGEAYSLNVQSERAVGYGFNGATPSAQQLVVSQPSPRTFSLAAPSGAKAGKYLLTIFENVPQGGRVLPEIEITVGTALVQAAVRNTPGTTGPNANRIAFGQRRALMGLGANIASETDPAWIARVQKLDNCFRITPSDGKLTDKLIAELQKSEPVKSTGDCPGPKQAATGTPGTGTGGGNTAPIPPPPNLGGNAATSPGTNASAARPARPTSN